MTLAIFGRRWVQGLGLLGAAAAGYVFGLTADRLSAQAPAASAANKSWVAMIYGNVPVTREELGEFLIARGGYEKVDLVVNKQIIEIEAARRNITVTARGNPRRAGGGPPRPGHLLRRLQEARPAALRQDALRVDRGRHQAAHLLSKMCRDRVTVTEADLKRLFENKYGEKRQAKIICWNKGEVKAAQKDWEEARKGDMEFDSIARTQADPNLAAAAGSDRSRSARMLTTTAEGKEAAVETVLFSLKVGEISQLFQLRPGIMCVKCVAIIDPDKTVKLEQVKPTLQKEVFDRKLSNEIPKFFTELKKRADPKVFLKGPPTAKEFAEGTKQILKAAGITPPSEMKKP